MAHAAQKVRFGGVGQRGLLRRFSQALLIVDLLLLLCCDVAREQHYGGDFIGAAASLRDEQDLVPTAVHRLEKALAAQTLGRGGGIAEGAEGGAVLGDDDAVRDGVEHLVPDRTVIFQLDERSVIRQAVARNGVRDGTVLHGQDLATGSVAADDVFPVRYDDDGIALSVDIQYT